MVVVPGLGGVAVVTPGPVPAGRIWGPINTTGLAPGGYAIYVTITFMDGMARDIVCSPVNFLTVGAGPAAGPVPGTVQGVFTPGKGTVSANGTYTTNTGWTAKASALMPYPWEEAKFPWQLRRRARRQQVGKNYDNRVARGVVSHNGPGVVL